MQQWLGTHALEKELGLGSTLRCVMLGPSANFSVLRYMPDSHGYGVAPSPTHRAHLHLTRHVFMLPLLPPQRKVDSIRAGTVSALSPRCPSPEKSPAHDRRAELQKQTRKAPMGAIVGDEVLQIGQPLPGSTPAGTQQAAPFGFSELTH